MASPTPVMAQRQPDFLAALKKLRQLGRAERAAGTPDAWAPPWRRYAWALLGDWYRHKRRGVTHSPSCPWGRGPCACGADERSIQLDRAMQRCWCRAGLRRGGLCSQCGGPAPDPGHLWARCLCDQIDPADRPCFTCEARGGADKECPACVADSLTEAAALAARETVQATAPGPAVGGLALAALGATGCAPPPVLLWALDALILVGSMFLVVALIRFRDALIAERLTKLARENGELRALLATARTALDQASQFLRVPGLSASAALAQAVESAWAVAGGPARPACCSIRMAEANPGPCKADNGGCGANAGEPCRSPEAAQAPKGGAN